VAAASLSPHAGLFWCLALGAMDLPDAEKNHVRYSISSSGGAVLTDFVYILVMLFLAAKINVTVG